MLFFLDHFGVSSMRWIRKTRVDKRFSCSRFFQLLLSVLGAPPPPPPPLVPIFLSSEYLNLLTSLFAEKHNSPFVFAVVILIHYYVMFACTLREKVKLYLQNGKTIHIYCLQYVFLKQTYG